MSQNAANQMVDLFRMYQENMNLFLRHPFFISTHPQTIPTTTTTQTIPTTTTTQTIPTTTTTQTIPTTTTTQTIPTTTTTPPVRPSLAGIDNIISIQYELPMNEPSVERPRFQDVANALQLFVYDTDHPSDETVDPISHNEFQHGDILCRILACQHTFSYKELMQWLDVSASCPVCRTRIPVTTSRRPPSEGQNALLQLLRAFLPSAGGETGVQLEEFLPVDEVS